MLALRSLLTPPEDHLRALTGLRGVAAGWVLLYHLWQFAGGPRLALGPLDVTPLVACGYFGVDLFFVLSGFLLGQPFLRARMAGDPAPALGRFWVRRLRRVLPAYWTQLASLLAVGAVAGAPVVAGGEVLAHALLVFNLFDNGSPINPVYWSLPVEWDFYMVLPLLALGFARGSGRPWMLPLALLFAFGFRLLCGWAITVHGMDGVPLYRWVLQLPGRVDQFVFGMTAAWLCLRGIGPVQRSVLAIGGLALILLQAWLTAPRGDFVSQADLTWLYWHYSVLAAGMAALIAAAANAPAGWPARLFSGRLLGWLGLISYSLYLWHYPLLDWLRGLPAAGWSAWLVWGLVAPSLALSVATLSYLLFERPFLAARRAQPAIAAATAP